MKIWNVLIVKQFIVIKNRIRIIFGMDVKILLKENLLFQNVLDFSTKIDIKKGGKVLLTKSILRIITNALTDIKRILILAQRHLIEFVKNAVLTLRKINLENSVITANLFGFSEMIFIRKSKNIKLVRNTIIGKEGAVPSQKLLEIQKSIVFGVMKFLNEMILHAKIVFKEEVGLKLTIHQLSFQKSLKFFVLKIGKLLKNVFSFGTNQMDIHYALNAIKK